MAKKKVDIGLRQAHILCQMPHQRLLEFLAEGLPIILASAQGFWQASRELKSNPRESNVLAGYAEEEAAKILILVDAVRCPSKLLPAKMGTIANWFYDHLARLIYAESVIWKPSHVAELREYVEVHRKAHYLEGFAGEYIMPNWSVYERESRLYADIEIYGDGEAGWNSPTRPEYDSSLSGQARAVAEAMCALGILKLEGLKATSDVWGQMTFTKAEDPSDAERLTKQLLKRLVEEKLPSDTATQHHVDTLFDRWQLPMYDFDFSRIHVSLEELRAEQDRKLWSEIGNPY